MSLALNWLLHHTATDCVILGASRLEQVDENLKAMEEGPAARRHRSPLVTTCGPGCAASRPNTTGSRALYRSAPSNPARAAPRMIQMVACFVRIRNRKLPSAMPTGSHPVMASRASGMVEVTISPAAARVTV